MLILVLITSSFSSVYGDVVPQPQQKNESTTFTENSIDIKSTDVVIQQNFIVRLEEKKSHPLSNQEQE